MLEDVTQKTINSVKAVYGGGNVKKAASVTLSSGLTAYDLQAPAKNLYPVLTPIRNALPRVGGIGPATNWKQVTAITNGAGYGGMAWVAEGQRAGKMGITTANKSASYVTMGTEISVSFEAFNAGRGFEDEKARNVIRGLQQLMLLEEIAIIGGNNSLSLGTTPTPTSSTASNAAATINATTSTICVAMTIEGYRNWVAGGSSLSTGLVQSKSISGQDGATYSLNGGYAQQSSAKSQAVTTGNSLTVSVTPVKGAVAYAWYIGTAGSEKLEAVTTVATYTATALAGTGQAASALTAADYSTNSSAFDGFLTTAASNSTAYYQALTNGSTLTASGNGSVTEIDQMLYTMWNNAQVSPSRIFVNAQELKYITSKTLTGGSGAPLVRYQMDNNGNNTVQAGQVVGSYYNPYAAGGAVTIPVQIHPALPPGTILAYADNLPIQYQDSNVPNVAEIKARQDYYEIDWPQVTREYRFGVYTEEVLAIYAPFGIGVITNITAG